MLLDNNKNKLTLSRRRPLSYRNQSIDIDWFLYYNGLRHERVKQKMKNKHSLKDHIELFFNFHTKISHMTKKYFLMRHYYYKKSRCGRVTLIKVLNNYGIIVCKFSQKKSLEPVLFSMDGRVPQIYIFFFALC